MEKHQGRILRPFLAEFATIDATSKSARSKGCLQNRPASPHFPADPLKWQAGEEVVNLLILVSDEPAVGYADCPS